VPWERLRRIKGEDAAANVATAGHGAAVEPLATHPDDWEKAEMANDSFLGINKMR
jgi:hypothetical protein